MSEDKFLRESKTGDILLFRYSLIYYERLTIPDRTQTIAARLQRSVTRSDYDHVALLLKYSDGDIVLLEATGLEGVGVCKWSTFKRNNWHTLYDKYISNSEHYRLNMLDWFIGGYTLTGIQTLLRKQKNT